MVDLLDVSLFYLDGTLASEELFFLDLKQGDSSAAWTFLSTSGKSPGKRYGHSLCSVMHNVILFGGNTGNSPSNDVFILNLSIDNNSTYTWQKLELSSESSPSPRVYHSACICTKGNATGMMIVFGGRNSQDLALNDTWGLRRHRDGTWDWTKAPTNNNSLPKERYNVSKFLLAFHSIFEYINGCDRWKR